ncbi:MAG TPA: sigma-70 family RNA polymerase sigma factor [Terracidiphilus sp.]|nr:sigma-70 family RNA polymerase sigma factor [Terracidiphilus sp.]
MAYLQVVDAAPIQPSEDSDGAETPAAPIGVHPALLDELWQECGAGKWGLERSAFDRIVVLVAEGQNPAPAPTGTSSEEQGAFLRSLRLADLVLAKACAAGNDRAWEHFMAQYGQPMTRAAIAISGSETVGRDLADAFYAELYGLNTRDGERKCPLDSYRGRGSLLGWLRTTLAQRFVDHYRRTYREQAFDEEMHDAPSFDGAMDPEPGMLVALREAVKAALHDQPAEERFLLAAYYADERTLAEIGKVLHVHEATISRRLRRATDAVRKQLMRNLEKGGMSRKAAEEALGTDPRDLDLKIDLRKLLQSKEPCPFKEQETWKPATAIPAVAEEALTKAMLSETNGPLEDKAKTTG